MTLLQTALQLYGAQETPGPDSNPLIQKMLDWMGFDWAEDSSLAWCSVFMNYIAFQAGYEKSGAANAKSWLDVGETIILAAARPGDVVIFHRGDPSSWQGHVGFYINHDDNHIFVLGGNQSNQVNISKYPISRLAGVRRIRQISPSKGAALEGINIEP